MGLLEEKRVLYFLILFGFVTTVSHAATTGYFDSKVDFFAEKDSCPSCQAQKEPAKKVEQTVSDIKSNLLAAQGGPSEVSLFIASSCRFFDDSIRILDKFAKKHPEMAVKVFVNAPTNNFLIISKDLVRKYPQWSIINDPTAGNAWNMGVFKVPAYVFAIKGRYYRISGTPDLDQTLEQLNAKK